MRRTNTNASDRIEQAEPAAVPDPPGMGTTRRAVIAGAAVGLAGLVADAVIAQPAGAANGTAVLLGGVNSATATTAITTTAGAGLLGISSGFLNPGLSGSGFTGVIGEGAFGVQGIGTGGNGSYGIYGTDDGSYACIAVGASLANTSNASPALQAKTAGTGTAVEATNDNAGNSAPAVSAPTNGANGTGIYGNATGAGSIGVEGTGETYGVFGVGDTAGIFGTDAGSHANIAIAASLTNAANESPAVKATTAGTGNAIAASITNPANTRSAVSGTTNGIGPGVHGVSSKGTGVLAQSTSGDALKVIGKIAFSRSGLAKVAARKKSVKVTLSGVSLSSMILATLQSNAGSIAVANALPGAGSFTINLTAAHSRPVKVAWFIIG